MMPTLENPINYGAFHYLKNRGYKIKTIAKHVRDYANYLGINKIDYLLIPEINKIISSDFTSFRNWVKENVENKNKERYN